MKYIHFVPIADFSDSGNVMKFSWLIKIRYMGKNMDFFLQYFLILTMLKWENEDW